MQGIAALGEVMIELSPTPEHLKRLAYAGDTYNTAVYLARQRVPTCYVTRLGCDTYSDAILAELACEQVDARLIERDPQRQPGLYIIHNTPDGERQFSYWRDQSAARLMFAAQAPNPALLEFRMIYLSGISIAIISPEARARLLSFLAHYKSLGGLVAFDSNYRPKLWPDPATAQQVTADFLRLADIALLTLEDEQALWSEPDQRTSMDRLLSYNLPELVVKRGAEPALLITSQTQRQVPVTRVDNVVDTTAAGDSFNAGYLAARYLGHCPEQAVRQGALCAGAVIQHRGAIVPAAAYLDSLEALSARAIEDQPS